VAPILILLRKSGNFTNQKGSNLPVNVSLAEMQQRPIAVVVALQGVLEVGIAVVMTVNLARCLPLFALVAE
jgi:hypothetical protein